MPNEFMIKHKKELREIAHKLVDLMGLEDLEYFVELWSPKLDYDLYGKLTQNVGDDKDE